MSLSLTDRVTSRLSGGIDLPPAVDKALRLADQFGDISPEAYTLPRSDTLDAYRPLEIFRGIPASDP